MAGVSESVSGLSEEQIQNFQDNGCLIIPDYYSSAQCSVLRNQIRILVEKMDPKEHVSIFTTKTDVAQGQTRDDYFMTSGDKIRFFFEDAAFDEEKKLKYSKLRSLNKIGHALHVLDPEFKKATFTKFAKTALVQLGFAEPAIVQSMYIFKNPLIGGEVTPHQDGTFLNTEPTLKLLGLWIALEDATEENGCLSFIPGSHKGGLDNDRRMIRNTDPNGPITTFTAPLKEYDPKEFVAAPVKAGSLVLIDTCVVHSSTKNTSEKSREIYTFHVTETRDITWSKNNWLQPSEEVPFTKVNQQY